MTSLADKRRSLPRGGATRRGSLLIELIASLGVLTTVIVVATPLTVRHGRLLTSAREYRIAIEEMSNQLERLAVLPASERSAQAAHLAPSEFAAKRLRGAKLTATLAPADVGERITLELVWDERQRRDAPVRLVAWLAPASAPAAAASGEEDER
jgi:hypothetical protein